MLYTSLGTAISLRVQRHSQSACTTVSVLNTGELHPQRQDLLVMQMSHQLPWTGWSALGKRALGNAARQRLRTSTTHQKLHLMKDCRAELSKEAGNILALTFSCRPSELECVCRCMVRLPELAT